jgi:hypothetical protein
MGGAISKVLVFLLGLFLTKNLEYVQRKDYYVQANSMNYRIS